MIIDGFENIFYQKEDTQEVLNSIVGKIIKEITLDKEANYENGAIVVVTTEGDKFLMYDDGQSCRETRHITTDDDLAYFSGATWFDIEVVEMPDIEVGAHELAFLKITTSLGVMTFETHVEHDGYYGGFEIAIEKLED